VEIPGKLENEQKINIRVCDECREKKILGNFPLNKTSKGGYRNVCKQCRSKAIKSHREMAKKIKEPEKPLQQQIAILCTEIIKMKEDEAPEKVPKVDFLKQLMIDQINKPTNKFFVEVLPFGEKSSMVDSII
jgi:hypothetical protein